jgi:hypothetical protein
MKKLCLSIALIIYLFFNIPNGFAGESHSGQAISQAFRASGHASKSLGHSIAGSGQAVSAVAAVPFLAVGASGAVSARIGHDLHDAAMTPAGEPFEITDETLTIGPPPDLAINPDLANKDQHVKKDPVSVH